MQRAVIVQLQNDDSIYVTLEELQKKLQQENQQGGRK
jgi:hypothetical protein